MDKHTAKMIAPIVIAVLFILYYIGFAVAGLLLGEYFPIWLRLCFGLIPLALIGVIIYVLVKRINEIRSGEEDDLSQY